MENKTEIKDFQAILEVCEREDRGRVWYAEDILQRTRNSALVLQYLRNKYPQRKWELTDITSVSRINYDGIECDGCHNSCSCCFHNLLRATQIKFKNEIKGEK